MSCNFVVNFMLFYTTQSVYFEDSRSKSHVERDSRLKKMNILIYE